MKKLYLLPLILLIFNIVNSQNWKAINKNEKYNYFSGDNIYKTIWADSIKIINNDSVFFLNKVIKKVEDGDRYSWPNYASAYYLENQSQFLLSQIIYSENNGIVMKENDSIRFLIKTHTKLNDTWVFDSLKNITATVIDASITMLFEHMDSIKVIKLSNNDTIVLSKNYGILKFPIFDTSHQHMNLVGIEGRNIGVVIPKFKDFYNFNVGDVFCYEKEFIGRRYYSLEYRKITIKGKIIKGDSIVYLNSFQSNEIVRQDSETKSNYINKDSTFIYIDNDGNFLNKYSDQILNSSRIGSKYKPIIVRSSKSIIDTMFAMTKSYKLTPLEKEIDSDTIIDHGGYFPPHELILQESSIFGNNLGLISALSKVYTPSYESKRSEKLIGCIKNGVVHGTILSDSFLSSISDVSIGNSIFNVYPNPANSQITIECLDNIKNSTLTVLNINGQELIKQQILNRKTKIDISNMKNGTYILKVITDKTVEVRKIIKE